MKKLIAFFSIIALVTFRLSNYAYAQEGNEAAQSEAADTTAVVEDVADRSRRTVLQKSQRLLKPFTKF